MAAADKPAEPFDPLTAETAERIARLVGARAPEDSPGDFLRAVEAELDRYLAELIRADEEACEAALRERWECVG